MAGDSVNGEVDAFVLHTRAIIVYERTGERRYEGVVAQASLNYPLRDMHTLNMPRFPALYNIELVEPAAFIGASHQSVIGIYHIVERVRLISLGTRFPTNPGTAFLITFIQVVECENLLVVSVLFIVQLLFLLSCRLTPLIAFIPSFYAVHPNELRVAVLLGRGSGYIMILTIKRAFAAYPLCKKRPINHIGVIEHLIYPRGTVIHSFCKGTDFTLSLLCLTHNFAKSERHAVTVTRIVVIGITVVVHVAEVSRITRVRRAQPPIVLRTAQQLQRITDIQLLESETLAIALFDGRDKFRFLDNQVHPPHPNLVLDFRTEHVLCNIQL